MTAISNSTTPGSCLLRIQKNILFICAIAMTCLSSIQIKATPFTDYNGQDLSNQDLHNQDFTSSTFIGANLTGATLTGAFFISADVSGVDFHGMNLSQVYFEQAVAVGVNMSGVSFSNTSASYTYLDSANFGGANLSGADLFFAIFDNSILTNADLSGAIFNGTHFHAANFSNAILTDVHGSNIGLEFSQFNNANLSGIQLSSSGLQSADFTGAIATNSVFSNAYFTDAHFINADFSGSALIGCDMSNSVVSGANFSGANLTGTTLNGAIIQSGSSFHNANLAGVNLDNASLDNSTDLSGVSSGGITGTPAALPTGWVLINGYLIGPGANLAGANLSGADLSGLDLAGVSLDGALLDDTTGLYQVRSGGITGTPVSLPFGFDLRYGYILGADANLSGANLGGADLTGIDLRRANLSYAVLSNAIVTNTILDEANLSFANLLNADFHENNNFLMTIFDHAQAGGANFNSCQMQQPSMIGVSFYDGSTVPADLRNGNMSYIDFTGADFTQARVEGAYLEGANLSYTALHYSHFHGAALPSANLNNAQGYEVDLSLAYLGGASLTNTHLYGSTSLENAVLQQANLNGVVLDDPIDLAHVTSGKITGTPATLPTGWALVKGYLIGPGAFLEFAELNGADLHGLNFRGADLGGADLTGANVTGADFTGAILTDLYSGSMIITAQPQSQTINAGTTLTLSITAFDSGPITYQWKKNGSVISNATDSVLSIPGVLRTNNGSYTVVVTGSSTVTIGPAVVKVIDPVFTTQPASFTTTLGTDTSHVFSAVADGTPNLRYQWYVKTNATRTIKLAHQTNTTLTVSPISLSKAGSYFCVVTNPLSTIPGENVVTSDTATLTIYRPPTVSGPANIRKTAGNTVVFAVKAGPLAAGPFAYQWKIGAGNLPNDAHFIGANTARLTIVNIQSPDAATYQCEVANLSSIRTTTLITHGILTIVPDDLPPASAILHPTQNTRTTNGVAVAKQPSNIAPEVDIDGKASDTGLITDVTLTRTVPPGFVQSLVLTQITPGKVLWTNHVTLVDGTNTFVATATDSGGHQTASKPRTYYLLTPAALTVTTNGNSGTSKVVGISSLFGTPANGVNLDIGIGYNIKTVPQRGKTFVNWTDGNATVLGTTTNLHFIMSNGLILNANYAP